MTLVHKVTGYHRGWDRLEREFEVDPETMTRLRAIVCVPAEDEQAIGSYPIANGSVQEVGRLLQRPLDTDRYSWYLEPMDDQA